MLVKAENLQLTGSFKVRGATNALSALSERGALPSKVVTISSGNHAAALAYAGRRVGIECVVFMPPWALPHKVEEARRHGAVVKFAADVVVACHTEAAARGLTILHSYDDLDVIAGQGTVGLEIAQVLPEPGTVLVPIGGGGLISGVAAALRSMASPGRIVGVEPAQANAMTISLAAGRATQIPHPQSLADGLTAPSAGVHTYRHVASLVDEVVEVCEEAIHEAWVLLSGELRGMPVEPSAAAGLAALLQGVVKPPANGPITLVVTGGNTATIAPSHDRALS